MPEIEEGSNTSTNASPRPSCLTPQVLADSMVNSMMESVEASVSKHRCGDLPTIYEVPQRIRLVKEVAYEPQTVSIGPYHHGKKSLQGMEENKWLYLHSFLSRNPNHRLEDYLMEMKELENEARSCYSKKVNPQMSDEFVKMMVLDGCFIVEFFLRFTRIQNAREELGSTPASFLYSEDFKDPIFRTIEMASLIGYDILLLENQIPFFLLHRIFEMACPVQDEPHLLEKMALQFFDHFMPTNKKIEIKDSYYHLLHLFHSHLLPTPTNSNEELNLSCNPKIKSVLNMYLKNLLIIFLPCSNESTLPISKPLQKIPCATDLQLAGFKFKKNKKSNNILNVKFSHGVFEITPFVIHGYSDTLFRNLLAFEQCYPLANDHFTTYLVFMDCLVNTSKDVALLNQNGIIDHLLGSDDDVAHLFNRLSIGIFHTFEGSYLSDLHDNLQKHCKSEWNMWQNKRNIWLASLKQDYFTNPWSVISLIAASILLLVTITQTFFTVFPYYRPRS